MRFGDRDELNGERLSAGEIRREKSEQAQRVSGRIVETKEGWLVLKEAETGDVYTLYDNAARPKEAKTKWKPLKKKTEADLRKLMTNNATVTVRGTIHEHKDSPPGIHVRNHETSRNGKHPSEE